LERSDNVAFSTTFSPCGLKRGYLTRKSALLWSNFKKSAAAPEPNAFRAERDSAKRRPMITTLSLRSNAATVQSNPH
jgi:hypothetical protein